MTHYVTIAEEPSLSKGSPLAGERADPKPSPQSPMESTDGRTTGLIIMERVLRTLEAQTLPSLGWQTDVSLQTRTIYFRYASYNSPHSVLSLAANRLIELRHTWSKPK
jgi:hypothetical protein